MRSRLVGGVSLLHVISFYDIQILIAGTFVNSAFGATKDVPFVFMLRSSHIETRSILA